MNPGPSRNPDPAGQDAISVSAGQFAELLAAINNTQKRMDAKLEKFQEEVRQGPEEAAAKVLKVLDTKSLILLRREATRSKPLLMPKSMKLCAG